MKSYKKLFLALILALAVTLPVMGQDRPATEDTGRGGRSGGESPVTSDGPSITSRGVSVGDFSGSSGVTNSTRDTGGNNSSISSGSMSAASPAAASYVPNLQGTSFNSINSYYEWQNFFWLLRTRYLMDSFYFSRFYRNSEPLITPDLMKLTLREPLSASAQLVTAVNDLEGMLTDLQAGKVANKQEIAAKSREIRDLAKKIRSDQSLAFIDQRTDADLAKGRRFDNLGLEGIREMREMVTDLHNQLKGMYTQTATSTVSVHSLTKPSFESLSKGIEKLSKVIENSARRL